MDSSTGSRGEMQFMDVSSCRGVACTGVSSRSCASGAQINIAKGSGKGLFLAKNWVMETKEWRLASSHEHPELH